MNVTKETRKHYEDMLMLYFDVEFYGEPWATEDFKNEQATALVDYLERKHLLKTDIGFCTEGKKNDTK